MTVAHLISDIKSNSFTYHNTIYERDHARKMIYM